jgi:hypothetical protein
MAAEVELLRDSDLALLRAHEPVLRYTRGELFLPTAVEPYVEQCSLWIGVQGGDQTLLVAPGEMTVERLTHEGLEHRGRPLFLRFVQRPLDRQEFRRWRRLPRERLSSVGRFTTTGLFGRLIDAVLRASLLLRGKVPAGLAASAETTYRERLDSARFTYYGRVVREGGYVCLQYWFFYAMNDWRSTFAGINDHEADWEMVTVYLAEHEDGRVRPNWVAFSSHDYHGDDLRRRWDDPELTREGEHPVVFAGAGSHSGAFVAGDYVITVDPPRVGPLIDGLRRLSRWLAPWRREEGRESGLGIPFVDYARGDGATVGAGHDREWTPVLIDDETPWVRDYRGLWGLDTRDRFGGERAPSGPRYERDGTVRTSWANPLGWAGLLKVAPDDGEVRAALEVRVGQLDHEVAQLDAAIEVGRSELRGLRAQAESLRADDYARTLAREREAKVARCETELNQRIAARTTLAEERRVHVDTLSRPRAPDAPQAHLTRRHLPHVQEQERRTRFLRFWASISAPLVLGSIIVVLVASPLTSIATIGVLVALFASVEAIARRRLLSLVASTVLLVVAIVLVAGLIVLFLRHWRIALSIVLGMAAVTLLVGNIRDLRRG